MEQRYGVVSSFTFKESEKLRCQIFPDAGIDWLHCIVGHRKKKAFPDMVQEMKEFDVVAGKIANDNTNATIATYMAGVFGEIGSEVSDNLCISLLLPERLQDQYCFRTNIALNCLTFMGSEKNMAVEKMITETAKKHAIDLIITMVVDELAEELQLNPTEILADFLLSKTGKLLYEEESKVWWDGPSDIAEQYRAEKRIQK